MDLILEPFLEPLMLRCLPLGIFFYVFPFIFSKMLNLFGIFEMIYDIRFFNLLISFFK